jgi:hypothetical protein
MNNYVVTLYRNTRERFDHAIEANSAEEALKKANEMADVSVASEWDEDGVSEVIDFEVRIAR